MIPTSLKFLNNSAFIAFPIFGIHDTYEIFTRLSSTSITFPSFHIIVSLDYKPSNMVNNTILFTTGESELFKIFDGLSINICMLSRNNWYQKAVICLFLSKISVGTWELTRSIPTPSSEQKLIWPSLKRFVHNISNPRLFVFDKS